MPSEVCVVCQNALLPQAGAGTEDDGAYLAVTKCRHIYHDVCLEQALQGGSGKCPLCREDLEERDTDYYIIHPEQIGSCDGGGGEGAGPAPAAVGGAVAELQQQLQRARRRIRDLEDELARERDQQPAVVVRGMCFEDTFNVRDRLKSVRWRGLPGYLKWSKERGWAARVADSAERERAAEAVERELANTRVVGRQLHGAQLVLHLRSPGTAVAAAAAAAPAAPQNSAESEELTRLRQENRALQEEVRRLREREHAHSCPQQGMPAQPRSSGASAARAGCARPPPDSAGAGGGAAGWTCSCSHRNENRWARCRACGSLRHVVRSGGSAEGARGAAAAAAEDDTVDDDASSEAPTQVDPRPRSAAPPSQRISAPPPAAAAAAATAAGWSEFGEEDSEEECGEEGDEGGDGESGGDESSEESFQIAPQDVERDQLLLIKHLLHQVLQDQDKAEEVAEFLAVRTDKAKDWARRVLRDPFKKFPGVVNIPLRDLRALTYLAGAAPERVRQKQTTWLAAQLCLKAIEHKKRGASSAEQPAAKRRR